MWESRAAVCATFPSGGGNPRFLRISTDAAFSIRPFTKSLLPTDFTEDPKYYMGGRNAVARPYVSGGCVLRFLSNAQQATYTSPIPGLPPPPIYHGGYRLDSNPSQGMAIGGGLSLKAGPIHIAPEIRYTGWFTVPFDTYGSHGFTVQSARDQVDLLVAVTF
jgi:hypothetical protein